MVMSHEPQLWVLYIFGENMQKCLHLKLPCETRVIWDTNNFSEKTDYQLSNMKKICV